MLVVAMMVCLGHGSNDVANAISPLLEVLSVDDKNHMQVAYIVGSFGIFLGLLLLGNKVMETVGKKVVKLDFVKGFSAQLATVISVITGSIIGIPLSTTHCMVGSLIGIVLTQRIKSVKDVYPEKEENKQEIPTTSTRETIQDISQSFE